MNYKFNPEAYGFEPIENFPELAQSDWYGANTFIKIIENGGETFGRKVFWYTACKLQSSSMKDDRVSFYSHSFDALISITKNFDLGTMPTKTYFGIINSNAFAIELLKNLFGTTDNNSAETTGKERLERNINEPAKLQYVK